MRVAFVVGGLLLIALGHAVYDGRADDAAGLAVFGLMGFGAIPFVVTWPE